MLVSPISIEEARRFASQQGFEIGQWNELKPVFGVGINSVEPTTESQSLYSLAMRLCGWINSSDWVLIQLDNSTFPTEDETKVFERIALLEKEWNPAIERTFYIAATDSSDQLGKDVTLTLMIYFAIVFDWHIHIISGVTERGKKLALLDGVIHFFGSKESIASSVNFF